METLSDRPPVRTGKCSLLLIIDGKRYRVSPAPPVTRGSKIWHLKVMPGQERAGRIYSICSFRGKVDCTCPDATTNGAVCKHSRALQALGLVAKTAKPSAMVAWEERQPTRRRKPPVPALTGSVPSLPPVKAKTRRLHVPELPNDPGATEFAAGFRDAVRSHLAGMAAARGGAL
jgi:hypothetical protein